MIEMRRLVLTVLLVGAASLASAQTPGAPGNLTVTVNADESLSLQWTAPSSGGAPTGYLVQIGTASGASDVVSEQIGNVTSFEVPAGTLAAGTYFVRVRALNPFGVSTASNEVMLTLACAPPAQAPGFVTWRTSATAVQFTWVAVPGVADYTIEVGTAPGLSDVATTAAGGGMRTFAAVTLPAPGTYYARVRATRACGDGPASTELTITAAEPAPSTSIVVNEFSSFVELKNISAVALSLAGWRIHTSTGSDQLTVRSATLPAGALIPPGCTYLLAVATDPLTSGVALDHTLSQAIVDGVAIVRPDGMIVDAAGRRNSFDIAFPDTPYLEGQALPARRDTAGIQSFARAGDQDTNSNAADFVPLITANPTNVGACLGTIPPGAPSELTSSVNGAAVTLMWTAPAAGGTVNHYRLEAGTAPGASNAGLFDLGAASTSITFGSVANGTFYVRIRAVNNAGVSAPSNEVVVTVCGGGCVTPPGPVTGLTFEVSNRNVLLQWNAPATGPAPDGYLIEAGTGPGLANLAQFPTGSTSAFAIVSSVPPGTYFVRVRAMRGGTPGPASNEVVIVVQ